MVATMGPLEVHGGYCKGLQKFMPTFTGLSEVHGGHRRAVKGSWQPLQGHRKFIVINFFRSDLFFIF